MIANDYGSGLAVYIGCMGKGVMDRVLEKVLEYKPELKLHGFESDVCGDPEVEVCRRGEFYFLLNHSLEPKSCHGLPSGLENALAEGDETQLLDPSGTGIVELEPFSYQVGFHNKNADKS